MGHFIDHINRYLQIHTHMGFIFAFVLAFAESLPIIGTIIPGSVVMTVIGILVGRGIIPMVPTLILASLGAFIGDIIGFGCGKYFKESILNVWPFKKYPHWIDKGETFFEKHGGKSIIIGRFVGPARSSVPLIAGLLNLNWLRFIVAAIPSAILWAALYLLPGVFIGAISLELPKGSATKFTFIGLAIIVAIWFVIWAIQRFFTYLTLKINTLIDRLWCWMNKHHSSKPIIRFITNRNNPRDHHQLTLIFLATFAICFFTVLAIVAATIGPKTNFNLPVYYFLQSLRSIHLNLVFVIITILANKVTIALISTLIIFSFLIAKRWRATVYFFMLYIVTSVCIEFFKWLTHSPRPTGILSIANSFSFPSGHATYITMLLGFCAYSTAQRLNKKWHPIPYIIAVLFIFLVCFSRLYLGAHWLEDVLAGVSLGAALLLTTLILYRRNQPIVSTGYQWPALISLCIIIPWILIAWLKSSATLHATTRVFPQRTISTALWWKNPVTDIPTYRPNRFGQPVQPFNVQYGSSLAKLKIQLLNSGWTSMSRSLNMKKMLNQFVVTENLNRAPIFPWLYRNQPPRLYLFKRIGNSTNFIELRLWRSGISLSSHQQSLWLGTVIIHLNEPIKNAKRTRSRITLSHSTGITLLNDDLGNLHRKIVILTHGNQPKKVRMLDWNGTILVIR